MEIVYLVVFIVVYAIKIWFFESKEDMSIVNDMGDNPSREWKFWGNANEVYGIAILVAVVTFFTVWQSIFLFPILWGVFWITHDFAMGYRLGKGIWYIGETGFDGKMKAMFQRSGIFYFIAGKLVWLAVFISLYLGL